jgi:hypothetical protein
MLLPLMLCIVMRRVQRCAGARHVSCKLRNK